MKKIWYVLLFILAIGLVACNTEKPIDEEKPPVVVVDEKKVAFENKTKFLSESNNYTMEISIKDYQTLESTEVMMVFDGQKSKYEDASYVAYYDHSGTRTKIYTQEFDSFKVTEVRKTEKDFYYKFKYEMFSESNGSYLLNYEEYKNLEKFSLLAGENTVIENVQIDFNETSIDKITFTVKIDGVRYDVSLTFSLVGQSSIQLPEVK